jgi:hypothetical protein
MVDCYAEGCVVSEHSKGPWSCERKHHNAPIIYIETTSKWPIEVAVVYCVDYPDRKANARLIATAPELFDIVTAVLEAIDTNAIANTSMEDSTGVLADFCRMAIAKVNGETA